MAEIKEKCGVFGVYSKENKPLASDAYYALFALQHRGQESCGIALNDDGLISCIKDLGLVNEVFTEESMKEFGTGKIVVGHVSYGSSAHPQQINAQPCVIKHLYGNMAMAYNGSITNDAELRMELEENGAIFQGTGDAEMLCHLFTRERMTAGSIEQAVLNVMPKLVGGYSMLIMSSTKLIAIRDPHGVRPLCVGTRGEDIIFASESCALDIVGAKFVRDIEPGEVVIVDKKGVCSNKDNCGKAKTCLCVFEYVYFARPDSVIDGTAVHKARRNAGKFLAEESPVEADVVIGVPDSGLDAAIGYSQGSGIPYGIGLIKNKYIGRTFIQPTQSERDDLVRIKLNAVSDTVKDKRVVLVDDSIVRGTTIARIVGILRGAGAKEVHMRVSCPPFLWPCYYGTDIDSKDKLIAAKYSVEKIAEIINVDSIAYLGDKYIDKIADGTKYGFCTACFNGKYPIPIPKEEAKSRYMKGLSEKKAERK